MAATKSSAPSAGAFRSQVPSSEHPASSSRYHLYVALFCPFAHRSLLAREMKGLQSELPISVVRPFPKGEEGWCFPADSSEYPGSTEDHLFHSKFLRDVYYKSPPDYEKYEGKFSVPVLWDKEKEEVVSNESEDIARMLNTGFNDFIDDPAKKELNFYPPQLKEKIDEINAWLVPGLNQGVYKAGFAGTQEDYETACTAVFDNLDKLEHILAGHGKPFILGEQMTELDFKAYATLIRFDVAYVWQFKLNMRMIRHDYKCIHRYLKNLYWNVRGFKETTDFKHIKEGYTKANPRMNLNLITPLGPVPDMLPWTEEDEQWRKSWK